MPIVETYTAELLAHLLEGLKWLFHADYKDDTPKPYLRSNYTATGAECVIEYKGQFYKITVEPLVYEK